MQVARIGSSAAASSQVQREDVGFAQTLAKAVGAVNRQELEAQQAGLLLASGEITDVHTVMIAAEKAELALDLTLAVRNKVLEAYQEIMRMQI
jgi:flagellar hook-basal body complex protein FliE